MLKKISIDQLRLGMHVTELCGSWFDHPFWRTRFLLKDQRDLDRIIDGGIVALWIDTSRGDDVSTLAPAAAIPPLPSDDPMVTGHREAAARDSAPARTSMSAELDRASRLIRHAKGAVASMFAEARMGKAIDAADALSLVDEINDSVARNPGAMINLARLKSVDDYTYMHSVAVCGMMVSLARQLKLDGDAVRAAGLAGLLHDMGKALVKPEILNKAGKLTEAEFAEMKRHPELGCSLLVEGGGVMEVALDVCLHHHERIDGAGYPHRLAGSQISLFARMGAVCDVYDAITSNRPYKSGWNPAESIRRMAEWTGHFDEKVFHAFVRSVGIYPVGSLVRMQSGRLAMVTEVNQNQLTSPRVTMFFSTKSDARIPPIAIDLARRGEVDRIVGPEDPSHWPFRDLDSIWAGASAPLTAPSRAL